MRSRAIRIMTPIVRAPVRLPHMTDLTIAICNYNHGKYLRDAIDSALAQTAHGVRVLIVDDGSTDDSRDIIRSYGERIAAVFQENRGQVAAYNRALEHVTSRYVILLDADDLLYADAAARVLAAFASGDFVKVHFRLDVIAHDGARTGASVPQSVIDTDCGRLLRAGWLYPSPPASGNAYQVAALKRIFPVPVTADNLHGADFYAIYGIALLGAVHMIDATLGGYRMHQQSNTSAADGPALALANSEDAATGALKAERRWSILRTLAGTRLREALPMAPLDFAIEGALREHAVSRAARAALALVPMRIGTLLAHRAAQPVLAPGQESGGYRVVARVLAAIVNAEQSRDPLSVQSARSRTQVARPTHRRAMNPIRTRLRLPIRLFG